MSRKFIRFTLCLVTFLTLSDLVLSFFDPLSLGLIAGGASLFYKREKVWEYTYCQVQECCIDSHIPADMTGNYNYAGKSLLDSYNNDSMCTFQS